MEVFLTDPFDDAPLVRLMLRVRRPYWRSTLRWSFPPEFKILAMSCSDGGLVHAISRDPRGAVAVIGALALTSVVGVVGLAIDVGMWYRTGRMLQNAADAAVTAAAVNGTGSSQSEAKAVAAQYGFVDGSNGITVTALNSQTCPSGATNCYKVTVAQSSAPLYFSRVLGISAPAISAAAMASSSVVHNYCLLSRRPFWSQHQHRNTSRWLVSRQYERLQRHVQ